MKMSFSLVHSSAIALLLGVSSLPAAVIFDTVEANGNDFVDTTLSLAQSFKTDAVNVRLTSVILRLDAAVNPAGGFFVAIYDATGPNKTPNHAVAVLSGSDNPATSGNYGYSPTGTLELSPNTSYWVVASVSSGLSQYPWRRKVPATIAVGSTIGSSENYWIFGFGWDAPYVDVDFCMQVNAQPAPGPSLALAPDGSGGFFIRCAGRAGLSYRLQRAASVGAPWSGIATNTAPPSGYLEFHDSTPLAGQAVYRAVQP
jgi:hypothetical protein